LRDVTLAFVAALKANAAIAAVVGTRVYRKGSVPTTIPGSSWIIVSKIPGVRDDDTNTGRRAHTRIQCSAFASTDLAADTLSELIADCLHRKQNTAMTAGASYVYVITVEDAGTATDENSDVSLYTYHRDFTIHYSYK
jgi:hypothetical protein